MIPTIGVCAQLRQVFLASAAPWSRLKSDSTQSDLPLWRL